LRVTAITLGGIILPREFALPRVPPAVTHLCPS
jgi:hypothetical protein